LQTRPTGRAVKFSDISEFIPFSGQSLTNYSGSLKIKKALRPCLRASAALRENILSLAEPQRRREKKILTAEHMGKEYVPWPKVRLTVSHAIKKSELTLPWEELNSPASDREFARAFSCAPSGRIPLFVVRNPGLTPQAVFLCLFIISKAGSLLTRR